MSASQRREAASCARGHLRSTVSRQVRCKSAAPMEVAPDGPTSFELFVLVLRVYIRASEGVKSETLRSRRIESNALTFRPP